MRVFVKWLQQGNDAGTVDLGLDNSLAGVRLKVAEATGTHPSLQVLVFGHTLLEDEAKTVREYGIGIDDTLRLKELPKPRTVILNVGGVTYVSTLATLRKVCLL